MKCYHCNVEIPEGSIFCPHCGKRIEVPKSLKCPQCNLDVPEGTESCPNCGSPIGTHKSTVCSKCGARIPEGGMFCPNCGKPSHSENGYQISGVILDAKDKFASKAEDVYQQSKKFINEKIQPQFDERINEFKSVDWDKKKEETSSLIKEFINNPKKIGIAIKAIAFLFVFGFVIKNGFSVSIIWYIIIAAMLFVAFMGIPDNKLSKLHNLYASAALCLGLMFIVSFGTSKNGWGNSTSPQVEFMEIIDKPETSFMAEIPNLIDSKIFEWTLIFFPENHEKTSGKVIMEPWFPDKNIFDDNRRRRYDYEIRDNHIELFNGYGFDISGKFNCNDLRFTIEEGDSKIQLRGLFSNGERIFKLNTYRDKANKEKHKSLSYYP